MTLLRDAPPVAPRFRSPQNQPSPAAHEAVELAASAGLVLDGWQVDWLNLALAETPERRWRYREAALVCPRQNGKNTTIEAVELAGLYLFGEDLILHSAHEFRTADEAFRRIWGLIENTADLERLVHRKLQNNNGMSIELKSGQRLRFLARTRSSGRGFSGDRIIFDEAFRLPDDSISGLFYSMAARPNPQVWYTSSAPWADEFSNVLRRVCKRGRTGDESLAYMEWCAEDGAALDDEAAWIQANPGYPHRISADAIRLERAVDLPEYFARERLGHWSEDGATGERVIDPGQWAACEDEYSQLADPVTFAVDVTPERTHSAIAAAGARADGRVHVEVVAHGDGTDWVVNRLAELVSTWKPNAVVLDPRAAAGSLIVPLAERGVVVQPISHQEMTQACGYFFDAVRDGDLRHINQAPLNVALAIAKKKPAVDAWVWHRKNSTGDISPLVAVTEAAWAHRNPVEGPSTYEQRELLVLG